MESGVRRSVWMRTTVAMTLVALAFSAAAHARCMNDAVDEAAVAPPEPAAPGAPGRAVEIWVDRSGITSAWLANGVLLHHKYIKATRAPEAADATGGGDQPGAARRRERPPAEVSICIAIAGADLLETEANRGISDAAVAAAWGPRSVRSMKAGELDAYLDASGASIWCSGGSDAYMLTINGDAAQVESALRGVRLMLSEPRVDEAALARWQEQTVKQLDERKHAQNNAIANVIGSLFGPQEARARYPEAETVKALKVEQVQSWLDSALLGAPGAKGRAMPTAVAITGDIPVDRAIRLAEQYFGSLPDRDRIAEATFADKRIATRAKKPDEVIEVNGWAGSPLVLVGFFGADISDIADHRALAVAAKILSNRMDRLPPEHNEGDHAFANAMPASVYPGFGLFLATTHAQAGSEAAASENINKLLDDVMKNGASAEELSAASDELSRSAARRLSDPSYWSWMLAHSTYQGMRLSEIGIAERVYREMKTETITAALKKYWTPERSIKLIVKPGKTAAPSSPAER